MNKKDERIAIKNKFGGRCAYCGELLPDKGWHVDHVKPVIRTGYKPEPMYCKENDNYDNKYPACASCNINKHQLSIEEFRRMIKNFTRTMNERLVQYRIAKKYNLIKETGEPVVFYFEKFNSGETKQ
jgi:5-methylcytosine-specific restriction endonuclease McrA